MKILIAGRNSYIGTAFYNKFSNSREISINLISLRDKDWEKFDFSGYDVILNVVGIAHIKENNSNKSAYYEVNRDLAVKLALKAKKEKVKQYIYISSMAVYGLNEGIIDKNTRSNPNNNYGKSKLEAEEMLFNLSCSEFVVSVIRPPMVYGVGCKGNYQKLRRFIQIIPIFPDIDNLRSVISIDKLVEDIREIMFSRAEGIYCPQNSKYVSTKQMVYILAKEMNKKIYWIKIFNPIIEHFNLLIFKKIFGSLIYKDVYFIDKEYRN